MGLRNRKRNDKQQEHEPEVAEKEEMTTMGYFRKYVLSRRRFSILLGLVLGVLYSTLHAQSSVSVDGLLPQQLRDIFDDVTNATAAIQVYFTGLNLESTTRIQQEILSSLNFRHAFGQSSETIIPSREFKEKNLTAHYPIIMVPGFTSTGLEIWDGNECSKQYFRERIWGTSRMFQQFMMNQRCWLDHLMMNKTTGLDPDGLKLRAAQGLEAADYVIGGYWVWGKVIQNLAEVGYDSNSMFMAAYDWRLSPYLMQKRDFFFTKLKAMIEVARITNDNRKVVLISHSYASQLMLYFMKWVESPQGGNMGPEWIDQNVHSVVNVAGGLLGTPKAVSSLMSGEMKDTAELGVLSPIFEYFFSPLSRAELLRTWTSLVGMLPIGGNYIWGTHLEAADDMLSREAPGEIRKVGSIDAVGSAGAIARFTDSDRIVTADNVTAILEEVDAPLKNIPSRYNYDAVRTTGTEKDWMNPLITPLPNAPKLSIVCLYGIDIPTERGYFYTKGTEEDKLPYKIDKNFVEMPWIRAGIRFTDGDGTVPLISLGYMCAEGWKSAKLNPGNTAIVIREHVHSPVSVFSDVRGGPSTSDHVDILGNSAMIKAILTIATGANETLQNVVSSNIYALSQKIVLPP